MRIFSKNEMAEFARKVAISIKKDSMVLLYGEVGAGKSFFASHFIAEICGIKPEDVISPTFNILQIYDNIYHFDLYRIKSKAELYEIGIYDIIDNNDGIILVEWPELIENHSTNREMHKIKIEHDKSGMDQRLIELTLNSGSIIK